MAETPNEKKPTSQQHTSVGPIIGSAIVVIVLLIGALYIWGQQLNKQEKKRQEVQKSEAEQEKELRKLKSESAIDLEDIQAEIDALNAEIIPIKR